MTEKERSRLQPFADLESPLTSEKIEQQLQRILDSPEFQVTEQQREFLQFVVAETIAGRSVTIKGYTVATQVFGRKEDLIRQRIRLSAFRLTSSAGPWSVIIWSQVSRTRCISTFPRAPMYQLSVNKPVPNQIRPPAAVKPPKLALRVHGLRC